jgi:hypothetical protein
VYVSNALPHHYASHSQSSRVRLELSLIRYSKRSRNETMPIYSPLTRPSPSSTVPPPKPLTEEQKSKYQFILNRLSTPSFALPSSVTFYKSLSKSISYNTKEIPTTQWNETKFSILKNSKDEEKFIELKESERMWLSREQILRILRSVKWDLEKGIFRLEETLVWRREFGIELEDLESKIEPEVRFLNL